MKKVLALVIITILCATVLVGCKVAHGDSNLNNPDFNTAMPNLAASGLGVGNANSDGWYNVFTDDFNGDKINPEIWTYSPHTLRWKGKTQNKTSYWCPDMVKVVNGCVEIRSIETTNHKCSYGLCPSEGRFSGGIETRTSVIESDGTITNANMLFEQAFGYFEAKVKFPNETGLWSAFWLQSAFQGKIDNDGKDGTEIDVYESAFINNPEHMGNALLWNGYGKHAKVADYIGDYSDSFGNLYNGFHTFGLKWTPEYYIFYIDGVPVWATKEGGVSQVAEFLRLTIEIDEGDGYGPHGQKIGKFKNAGSVFFIDQVRVYQNTNYLAYIKTNDFYK